MSIQRIESGSTNGYQVRVGPRHAAITKFFAVRKYGGVRKAFAEAQIAETSLQEQVAPKLSRHGARRAANANNSSGVVGVRPRYVIFAEQPYLYFVASWSIDGKAHSTSFSAEKHGTLVALEMALKRRAKATGVRASHTPGEALALMKHLIAGH